jgi:Snf7
MDDIRDQMSISTEISEAIARPALGNEIDEDELLEELDQLEQEELDNKLVGVDVPSQKMPTVAQTRILPWHDYILTYRTCTEDQRGGRRGSGIACPAGRDGDLIYIPTIIS